MRKGLSRTAAGEAGGGKCRVAECDGEAEGGERGAVRGDASGVVNSHT